MNNRRYVDFAGGIGAVLLGYADEAVNAALQRRILSGTYSTLVNPQEIELAKLLLELHPWASKVRYARGGGEAMTVAVRIARAATGKSGIAFCGYHGWHDWYLAANLGESNALDGHLLPGLQPTGVPRELYGTSAPFMYNDYASFEKALLKLEGNTAAVVMEPMRSQEPQNEFLEKIKAKCKEIGAVFVLDEISSGLRYGFPGAHTRLGIEPDMAVYAKAMGNGIPFGAIIGEESLMTKGEESFISSSYWTDGLGTAAALAVLKKIMEENVFEKVWEKGKLLQQELKHLSAKYPLCHLIVAGMPSTPNLRFQLDDLSSKAQQFYVRRMMEQGFLVSSIYYLMHAHQPQQIKAMLLALELTLKELENHIQQQTLETVILSKQAQSGFARLA